MAQDVAEPLAQLGAHLSTGRSVRLRGLRLADREDEQRRAEEAERVEEDGRGRSEPADQQAGDARPSQLRS